ncbi:hypothetical protein [Flavobacterium hydatis]|jgi:hypothetical protein|uniref:PsbP C-terminal domain-containing protein n=1 Tax=Flavobacterium hydatis TaxID=991 RepID=A0A086AS27_FLAHY|nr:hypothetical protein [Flavobacterium hydatis]KFF19491.1 hypothetical protein IW20_03140 [Flavobacterium hydatis]OXA96376.1 hypothetical protein B0A62_03680 [Flavobacterium hydatis]
MKTTVTSLLFIASLFMSTTIFAQSTMKEYKAGHTFNISLPDYMSKTADLNSSAAIQYKNVVKDIYGVVIFDTKEELKLLEMNYTSTNEFYEDFIKDFLKDEEKRSVSAPKSTKKGDISFIEVEATYFDKEINNTIYYLIGVVETKTAFYKVLSWASIDNKDKYKADFQKILYSIKE